MNANGKDKTIEFDIKKEMTPVKFRYLKKGKGGRKHIVAIIANCFFLGISKYVISKRFTINLYFIYLAQVLYV